MITRTIYQKEFLSRTHREDISHHGSAMWEDFQILNSEDEEIRKNIVENYSLQSSKKQFNQEHLGFDGEFQYAFSITGNPTSGQTSENEMYQTVIRIIKAGQKARLNQNCDLEEFLLGKGFEKVMQKIGM